jgi:hypothetical protein
MLRDVELWSPEQELRLLEELAEAEAQAFDMDPVDVAATAGTGEAERPWVAFWRLPPNGIRSKARPASRAARGR